jgi:hypothetical protein
LANAPRAQASFSLNIFSAFSGLFTSRRAKTSAEDADGREGRRSSDGEDGGGGAAEERGRVQGVRRSELATSSVARTETAQRRRVVVEELVDERDDGAGRGAVGRGKEQLAVKE